MVPATTLSRISSEFDATESAAAPRRGLAQGLGEVPRGARVLPGVPRAAHARRPAERGGLDARVVGNREPPRRGGGGARLAEGVLGEGLAVLGREHHARRQRVHVVGREQGGELPQLVVVAGGEDEPHQRAAASTAAAWTARSSSMPAAASSSSSSRCARCSGVRSAVACTSTSPPSPVITTLASTSAVESSE